MEPFNPKNPPQLGPYPKRLTYRQGWALYRTAMASHHIQGFLVSGLIFSNLIAFQICGILWFEGYIAYQFACYWRKRDSVGLDILDMLVGFGIGMAVFSIWRFI